MSFLYKKVSAITAAAQMRSETPLKGSRLCLYADPNNTGLAYIGRSDVTSSTGLPMAAADQIEVASEDSDLLYALASTGTQVVHMMWDSLVRPSSSDPMVDRVLASLGSNQTTIPLPIFNFTLADGTALAKFSNGASATPGFTLDNSKAAGIRWNNNGTLTAILTTVPMPQHLDDTAVAVLHLLVSKSGATVGDAVTFLVAAYFQEVAALADADTDCGGTSAAIVGNATAKTVSEVTVSIAAADVPPAPCCLTLTIKPTDGTLGTDDITIHAAWLEITQKLLAT